jgi:hypothetical protein
MTTHTTDLKNGKLLYLMNAALAMSIMFIVDHQSWHMNANHVKILDFIASLCIILNTIYITYLLASYRSLLAGLTRSDTLPHNSRHKPKLGIALVLMVLGGLGYLYLPVIFGESCALMILTIVISAAGSLLAIANIQQ